MTPTTVGQEKARGWFYFRGTGLVPFAGTTLYVNADVADGGYVKASVLSRTSKPVAGFGLEDAVAVTGDGTKSKVTWENNRQLRPSARQVRRIARGCVGIAVFRLLGRQRNSSCGCAL